MNERFKRLEKLRKDEIMDEQNKKHQQVLAQKLRKSPLIRTYVLPSSNFDI